MYKVIIGVLIATAVVIVGFLLIDQKFNNKNATQTNTTDVSGKTSGTSYTIEGEVNKAGTYSLSGDAITMADLIQASGGITANADPLAYFDDATLKGGSTYYIPSKYDNNDICSSAPITKVNINADSAETLTSINGITSSIATSIVSYRTSNGTFKTIEQLMEVYGIGNATYRKVRNYVILHA